MSDSLDRVAKLPPSAYTLEVRPVASPPVGTDFSITVNDGGVWRVRSIIATLVTSAVVANRAPLLTVDDQTTTSAVYAPGVVQAAGATVRYAWLLNYPQQMAAALAGVLNIPIVEHVLHQGWRVRPVTSNIDVGDQWSNVSITIERMLTPPHTITSEAVNELEREDIMHDVLLAGGFPQ